MNRALPIVTLLAILFSFAAPILLAADHHDDDLAGRHLDCDGDCGCLCHAGVQGVVASEHHEISHSVARAADSYRLAIHSGIPTALDRPPKLSF